MALRLNPLSTAKGKKFTCELCGKSATLACQHCRVTYYCAKEHQSVDWFGIHEKICQLLGALRTLRPTLGSEDERQRRNLTVQMSQHALIDLCKNEAQKHLVMGQYELAIPGALQSLRFSMEVYGSGRIELVPAYLLLAESNLGLRRYKVAEEFLLYANWSVLKNPDCSNELKSQLYRNFGKLYASQGRFIDALKQLANDVYYSSLESGPEHIDTAGGYFYMADVFLTQGVIENALALYDKVVDIWYKFLINLRHRPDESISDYLSEAHIGEAVEMLRSICETRRKHLGIGHIATGEASYALAILKHITGFDIDARIHYTHALEIYRQQLGQTHESTAAIQRAMDELPPVTGQQQQQLNQQVKSQQSSHSYSNQQESKENHSHSHNSHSHSQHQSIPPPPAALPLDSVVTLADLDAVTAGFHQHEISDHSDLEALLQQGDSRKAGGSGDKKVILTEEEERKAKKERKKKKKEKREKREKKPLGASESDTVERSEAEVSEAERSALEDNDENDSNENSDRRISESTTDGGFHDIPKPTIQIASSDIETDHSDLHEAPPDEFAMEEAQQAQNEAEEEEEEGAEGEQEAEEEGGEEQEEEEETQEDGGGEEEETEAHGEEEEEEAGGEEAEEEEENENEKEESEN